MAQTRVQVINETPVHHENGEWQLRLQWCRYIFPPGHGDEYGYRFIWVRPDGALQPARGQARIPSFAQIRSLMETAEDEGWGYYDGDAIATDQTVPVAGRID